MNPNAKNPDFAHHSYGSGPFIVNAVQPGSIELTRNEHYWADKPKTSQATLRYYTDEQKMADDLKAGKLNVALPPFGPHCRTALPHVRHHTARRFQHAQDSAGAQQQEREPILR